MLCRRAEILGGLIPGGWRFIPILYSVLMIGMAAAVWFGAPKNDPTPARGRPFRDMLAPLAYRRVWQYSLHYVVVFGAYVALLLQLPSYYVNIYGNEIRSTFGVMEDNQVLKYASFMTAIFIFPASLLRPLGGYLSDKFSAVMVLGLVLLTMMLAGPLLSGLITNNMMMFTFWIFILGCGMGIGKAAVYKLIPTHFPREVGSVGGLVGLLGALGGFVLPLMWGYLPTSAVFQVVKALTAMSLVWFFIDELWLQNMPVSSSPKPEPQLVPTVTSDMQISS